MRIFTSTDWERYTGQHFKDFDEYIEVLGEELNSYDAIDLLNYEVGEDGIDELALALKSNQSITSITLENTGLDINDAEKIAEIIRNNKKLKRLMIPFNQDIGNEGIAAIANALSTSSLNILDFTRVGIDNKGIKILVKGLQENNSLEAIFLGQNHIEDKGAKALAELIKVKGNIKHIDLNKTYIAEVGGIALREALKSRDNLNLKVNENFYIPDKIKNEIEIILHKNLEDFKEVCKSVENQTWKPYSFKYINQFFQTLQFKIDTSESILDLNKRYKNIKNLAENYIYDNYFHLHLVAKNQDILKPLPREIAYYMTKNFLKLGDIKPQPIKTEVDQVRCIKRKSPSDVLDKNFSSNKCVKIDTQSSIQLPESPKVVAPPIISNSSTPYRLTNESKTIRLGEEIAKPSNPTSWVQGIEKGNHSAPSPRRS